MNKHPGLDLVERARALAPLIAREADEIERTRRLTPAVTSALIENGLYRVLLPQSFGGTEAPLEIFMQMQEEIAKADASTAASINSNTPGPTQGAKVLGQSGGTSGTPPAPFGANMYSTAGPGTTLFPGSITTSGGSQPHQNEQPYLVLTFCIALQGIFPSRN